MSEIYKSLQDAVFATVVLEAQELKDQVERAKSLDIAISHPLKCEKTWRQKLQLLQIAHAINPTSLLQSCPQNQSTVTSLWRFLEQAPLVRPPRIACTCFFVAVLLEN
jgi:hypothetical protein